MKLIKVTAAVLLAKLASAGIVTVTETERITEMFTQTPAITARTNFKSALLDKKRSTREDEDTSLLEARTTTTSHPTTRKGNKSIYRRQKDQVNVESKSKNSEHTEEESSEKEASNDPLTVSEEEETTRIIINLPSSFPSDETTAESPSTKKRYKKALSTAEPSSSDLTSESTSFEKERKKTSTSSYPSSIEEASGISSYRSSRKETSTASETYAYRSSVEKASVPIETEMSLDPPSVDTTSTIIVTATVLEKPTVLGTRTSTIISSSTISGSSTISKNSTVQRTSYASSVKASIVLATHTVSGNYTFTATLFRSSVEPTLRISTLQRNSTVPGTLYPSPVEAPSIVRVSSSGPRSAKASSQWIASQKPRNIYTVLNSFPIEATSTNIISRLSTTTISSTSCPRVCSNYIPKTSSIEHTENLTKPSTLSTTSGSSKDTLKSSATAHEDRTTFPSAKPIYTSLSHPITTTNSYKPEQAASNSIHKLKPSISSSISRPVESLVYNGAADDRKLLDQAALAGAFGAAIAVLI